VSTLVYNPEKLHKAASKKFLHKKIVEDDINNIPLFFSFFWQLETSTILCYASAGIKSRNIHIYILHHRS